MNDLMLAFGAGVVTIAAPCILPMLPIILGATVGRTAIWRPLFIMLGFVTTFATAALLLGAFADSLGLSPAALRAAAIAVLFGFGALMLWPRPMAWLSGVAQRGHRLGAGLGDGPGGALLLGATLGLVWTPCAGPVLGSILALVAMQGDVAAASTLLLAYALGAGLPMLAIGYGGQVVTTRVRAIARHGKRLQQGFGALVMLAAVAMHFDYDAWAAARLADLLPSAEAGLGPFDLTPQGPAPAFVGLDNWLNGPGHTIAELRGRVVLVDFWTYGCVNCLRTVPHVAAWDRAYRDRGLTVIGIHTPEFAFERAPANVAAAVTRLGLGYPVAQDNGYRSWAAWGTRAWPTVFLIDRDGRIVLRHEGEGREAAIEDAIRRLLGIR